MELPRTNAALRHSTAGRTRIFTRCGHVNDYIVGQVTCWRNAGRGGNMGTETVRSIAPALEHRSPINPNLIPSPG